MMNLKKVTYQIKVNKEVLLHSLIGLLVGYFILHPISMVIYWFEFDSADFTFNYLVEVIITRVHHSFNLQMIPMGILFSSVGCGFGLVSGLYSKSIKKSIALNQINKQLLELEEIKSKFLQVISHEIRTPLNGIIESVNFLKDIVASDKLLTIIELLDQSVSRLETFSITALRITELQTSKHKLKKEKINLTEEIDNLLTDLSNNIHDKRIKVKRSNIPPRVVIQGNGDLIRICLYNILDNAVKYCNEHGEIEISVSIENKFVICKIIDNGVGFSQDTLNNLFKLFSTKGEHVDNSPGLVFPLLKLIMEAHEGKIEVNNVETGGAMIELVFPIIK